ncbi:MAG TPA: hypothetical protein VGJ15_11035 [Pirellulales bacterium]|jgi:hypothetical protein
MQSARAICGWTWLVALATAGVLPAAENTLPEPIAWRQMAFSIPFKVAAPETPDQEPAEIRLYVSATMGQKWEVAQTVRPDQRSFMFRAPSEGEYWFLIRTVDRQQRITPDVVGPPELRVLIDTTPPRLELTAARGETGELKASWRAIDPQLNADSLKIEYQATGGAWRPVAIDRPRGGGDRTTSTGTLTWFPTDAPAGAVAIRGEISDRAGNVTVTQAKAEAPANSAGGDLTAGNWNTGRSGSQQSGGSPQGGTSPFATATIPSWQNATGPNLTAPNTMQNSAQQPAQQDLAKSKKNKPGRGGQSTAATGATTQPPVAQQSLSQTAPQDNWLGRPPVGNTAGAGFGANPGYSQFPSTTGQLPAANIGGAARQFAASNPPFARDSLGTGATPWPADQRTTVPLGRNPIPLTDNGNDPQLAESRGWESISPPIRNQVPGGVGGTAGTWPAPGSLSPSGGIPPFTADASSTTSPAGLVLLNGQRPRLVNSRSFEIDYEVDGVSSQGISKVELWGTRDGGRSWWSFGVDPDNRSPIRVNVDNEGLYGFRLTVQRNGAAPGSMMPRSGDQPDMWVLVDMTRPMVRLTSVQPGDGPHPGELLITWQASDAALAARPISLLMSDRPGGPWTPIATNLENSGQFAWRPDPRTPTQIYLRIEARDEAGNMGSYETQQPVSLDSNKPEGRLRGVHAVGDTASGARIYQVTR